MRRGALPRIGARAAAVALGGLGACGLAGVGIAALRSAPGLGVDAGWAAAIAAARTPAVVGAAEVLAALGASPGSIVLDAVVVAAVLLRAGVAPALTLLAASGASELVVTTMKALVHRPGPSIALVGPYGSFPSGHTAFAAVLATSAVLLLGRRALPWAVCGVVAMALSRTVLAAHWLTDTVAGAVEGVATTVLVFWLAAAVVRRVDRRRDPVAAPVGPAALG